MNPNATGLDLTSGEIGKKGSLLGPARGKAMISGTRFRRSVRVTRMWGEALAVALDISGAP